MKRIITSLAVAFYASLSFSQIGAVAPDFTVTDINGGSHNLYTYLNAGKVVVLDVSATWCGPCWDFHSEHFLNEINAEYGPNGTNKVVVLFYEGDANTLANALNGTGGSTLGNWVSGVTYPIINEAPIQLNLDVFAPEGYPTINVICPSDKKIKADLFNNFDSDHTASINAMKSVIETTISDCAINGANINEIAKIDFKSFPNPTSDKTKIILNRNNLSKANLVIYSIAGNIISTNEINFNNDEYTLDLSKLESGSYYIQISDDENKSELKKIVKY